MKQTKLVQFDLSVKVILLFIAFMYVFSTSAYSSTGSEDTLMTVSVNGVKKQFIMAKNDTFWFSLKDLQHIINSCEDYTYTEILKDDLTGDGVIDTLKQKFYIKEDSCIIEARIISFGEVIYYDRVSIDNEYDGWGTPLNSIPYYEVLYPYSLLYEGYQIRITPRRFSKSDRMELFNISMLPYEIKHVQKKELKNYVLNYKGKFINSLSPEDPDTYIYWKKENKFILFYAP